MHLPLIMQCCPCLMHALQVIAKAKVPIIKFEETESAFNFDVSFDVANGPVAAEFVSQLMQQLPPMRPLVLVLKIFLQQREFNEACPPYQMRDVTTPSVLHQGHAQMRFSEGCPLNNSAIASPGVSLAPDHLRFYMHRILQTCRCFSCLSHHACRLSWHIAFLCGSCHVSRILAHCG